MKRRINEGSIGLAVAVVAAFTGLASACGSKSTSSGSSSSTASTDSTSKSGGGSGGPKEANCAFQKDPNNCWRKFVDSVKTCLGNDDPGEGKLADDGKTCTHKGRTVAFAKPPAAAEKGKKDIDFTVKAGDKECLHWTETGQGVDFDSKDMNSDFTMTGTSPFGKVVVHKKDLDWTLTCPDGSQWESSMEKEFAKVLTGDTAQVVCGENDTMSPNASSMFAPAMASFELGVQMLDMKGLKVFECMKG